MTVHLVEKQKEERMMETNKKIRMRDALRQLHQPEEVYVEYLNSSEDDQRFLEYVVHTVLEKGYMPA